MLAYTLVVEKAEVLMKRIDCKNIILTNQDTKICVPVIGKNRDEIICQLSEIVKMKPDIIEWRADFFESQTLTEYENVLNEIRGILGTVPMIFTFRTLNEGGNRDITWDRYCELCCFIAEIGNHYNVSFIDVEAYRNKEQAKELIEEIKKYGIKVIGSNHNFDWTPGKDEMIQILKTTEDLGADISKLAVMPLEKEDVWRLIEASEMADRMIKIPIITMSMGELGAVTRIATNLTKSVMTFAAGVEASAPGQIDINKMRKLLDINKSYTFQENIALIGFMGTGKTTVSRALSMITGLKEIDVDAFIVKKAGMSISEIFENYGEEYFRTLETEALCEIVNGKGQIISCGGGAVLKDENVELLKKNGRIVLLTASPETIFDRVKDHTHRPILNNDMSLEHVKSLMSKREPRYQSIADIKVNVDSNDRVLTCYDMLCQLEEKG